MANVAKKYAITIILYDKFALVLTENVLFQTSKVICIILYHGYKLCTVDRQGNQKLDTLSMSHLL